MKRVLIADDEVLVRIGIKSMAAWEQYGYTVVADASDGEEALEKIRQYEPHIVLTDLKMQPVDGFELISRCSVEYPQIRFIVLSNYNDFDNVRRAMKLGAKDYIFKLTIRADELLKILDEVSSDLDEEEFKSKTETNGVVYKNLGAIKNNLLKQVLTKKRTFMEGVQKGFDELGLQIDFRRKYCIMTIQLDSLSIIRKRGDFLEKELLMFSMENIITEILERGCKIEVFQHMEQEFIVVLNREPEQGKPEFFEALSLKFSTLVKYINQYYGLGISGAVSGETEGLENFRNAVLENREILENRFFLHTGMLLSGFTRRYEEMVLPEEYKPVQLEQFFQNGDWEGIEQYLDKLLCFLNGKEQWKQEDIRECLRKVYKMLNLGLIRYGIDIDGIRDSSGVDFEEAISGYSFYEDIEKSVQELFSMYREEFRRTSKKPCRREIAAVKAYVCDHMAEELSIIRMGELAGMSESRFSHLFKEETGVSFMEYVAMVRMEKARELLSSTDLRINEIAEQIGIVNPNYFSAQYKKRTGQSPGEFRRYIMEQNLKEK